MANGKEVYDGKREWPPKLLILKIMDMTYGFGNYPPLSLK
jgi:hypothetical protein